MNNHQVSSVFNEVLIFDASIFRDFRGTYVESFNEEYFNSVSDVTFVQDDFSTSKQNVLRGLHGDFETWKLVCCPYGEIYFVLADMREDSSTYLKWESFILNANAPKFILVPPGFANGHLVLSDFAVFHYKQSTYYGTQQFTVGHDDERIGVFWPNVPIIKSQRDTV